MFICFLSGDHSMELAVLLLLILPATIASPLSLTFRMQHDTYKPEENLQMSDVMQELKVNPPFLSQEMNFNPKSIGLKLRPKRAPQRGCQLGTCQLHNLANTLYQIGRTTGKDDSKKANDAHGYGR